MLTYALCRQLLQVVFTRFCCQIHQSARIGWQGGGQANLGNARILRASVTATPPLERLVEVRQRANQVISQLDGYI